jgi:hypothetical protein
MTAAPPPIAVDDLDREELLQLLSGRFVLFTVADLWRARWDVLSRRAASARTEACAALERYLDCAPKRSAGERPTHRQLIRELKAEEAAKTAWNKAKVRAERAEAAEDRAWKALEASHGRTAA